MGTYNHNGGRNPSDDNRPTWRPQDQSHSDHRGRGHDLRDREHDVIRDERWSDRDESSDPRLASDRDPRRWEGSRGSELGYHEDGDFGRPTERYGQGQSGYSAGRYGEDRSQHMRNRNELGSPYPSHDRDFGGDDRFSGRGGSAAQDRSYGNEPWRDDRGTSGSSRRVDPRHGQSMGYQSSARDPAFEEPGYGRSYGMRGSQDSQGYLGSQSYRAQDAGRSWQDAGRGGQDGRGMSGPRAGSTPRGWQDAQSRGHQHPGTGPHRGKGPVGYQRSDERIREMVCDALADDGHIDASQIHVTVKDGEVTLSGTVEDRRTKREAEDCVASVNGVRDVQIQLRIKDDRQGQGRSASATGGSPAMSSQPAGNGMASTTAQPETEHDKKPRA